MILRMLQLLKGKGGNLRYSDDDDCGESLMIKRDVVETVKQRSSNLKIQPPPVPDKIIEPVVKPEIIENIPTEFLVKSEQNKIAKKEK